LIPFDMPEVAPPSFPDRVVDVRAFGATDDGLTPNTEAFRQAITACHGGGGGVVRIPPGTWLTGPIHLRSNVNLRLEAGALLRFSTRFADYLPVVFTRWEGVECYNYSPLIYAVDCANVAVSGEGILDGQGQAWWHWKKLQQAAAERLYDAQFEGVPATARVFGTEGAALRPQFLQMVRCRNVLVEGVTFVNGPMWTVHPVYCENVLVRGIAVKSEGPNTDGLNPDSCRNVLIEGCSFHTGDDCIAINSGMNEDGWRVAEPCTNVMIRDCTMSEGHGAVTIGSGMSGGVRNVYVRDCRVTGGDQGVRLKSMRGRGGFVENVWFENIHMVGLRQEAIFLDMFYGSYTAASRSDIPPSFRNVRIRNITCQSARTAVALRGLPEQPIESVALEDLRLHAIEGIRCQDVGDIAFTNVTCIAQTEPMFSCSNVTGLRVTGMTLATTETEV
jgi:polygalacturonase